MQKTWQGIYDQPFYYEKICKECYESFKTTNPRKKKCDKCLYEKTLPKPSIIVVCSDCGRDIKLCKGIIPEPNKKYVCQNCQDFKAGILVSELSVDVEGRKLCPDCKEPLVRENCGRLCVNPNCRVICIKGGRNKYYKAGKYRIARSSLNRRDEKG